MPRYAFQRRHMRAIADVIRNAKLRPNDSPAECLSDLEQDFADLLARANPKFKPGVFFAACSPFPNQGRAA